jgi:uncharacterized membrane protein
MPIQTICLDSSAFVILPLVLFSPYEFHQFWVPIDVAAAFAIGALISSRSSSVRRLFSRKKYRAQVARAGAAAMFYEAGIANTNAEVGVIVYLSLLERRLEVIADRGVLKKVPSNEWNEALFELHNAGRNPEPTQFQNVLIKFGQLLGKHLMATRELNDYLICHASNSNDTLVNNEIHQTGVTNHRRWPTPVFLCRHSRVLAVCSYGGGSRSSWR